jgi:flagellar hook-associated protein 2
MSNSSGTNSLAPPVVSYGLVSGINTQQIIQAELQPFEIPINNLQSEQSSLNSNVSYYQQINTDILAMKGEASTLAQAGGWNARSATPSDPTVVSATANAGTPAGTIQFNVLQLAAANSLVSSGTASSTSQVVTSQPSLLLSAGAGRIGFSSLANGAGDALGSHTFAVTQSSQAAEAVGTTALASQSGGINVTTGTNDTVSVNVDGTAYNLVLAASPSGGYSGSGLLTAVQNSIQSAGASGVLQAGYNSSGDLVLATVDQGSSQTLQVTGGDALTTLGLSASSSTGADGVVTVDGVSNTLTTVVPGGAVTLNGSSGATFTATLAGSSSQQYVDSSLLQAGSVTATDVSTGSGSLSDVVSAINGSGTGIVASAVQTGTNQYVLQLSSPTTGVNGDLSIDPNAFSSSSLGAMRTAVAGQNAEIQVGGSGGYTVSSQNDTFTGLLPGLSVTALKVSSSPVTVTVASDSSAIASSVQSFVNDTNTVLADVQKYAGYNEATKTGGPLMGSATLQGLTNSILAAFASAVGTSNLGSAASIGVKISNGQISFDQTAFENAYNANPSEVQSLFTQGGSFAPASSGYTGQVSFSYATDSTQSGTYAVNVSHSATQATATGSTLASGTVGAGETMTIGMGSATATFTTAAGQSLTSVASGLNNAFAAQGMQLSAEVIGGNQLQLVSTGYGSATQFSVSTTSTASGTLGLAGAGGSATYSGTDVAGTINGVAATGVGQFLSAPASDPTLAGLSLQVTATGITTATNLGSLTYTPGLAQMLSTVSAQMSDPVHGAITQTVAGLQQQSVQLTPQIQMYQRIVNQQQQLLMAKYATMEATLGSLKNQSSALSSELAKIAAGG